MMGIFNLTGQLACLATGSAMTFALLWMILVPRRLNEVFALRKVAVRAGHDQPARDRTFRTS